MSLNNYAITCIFKKIRGENYYNNKVNKDVEYREYQDDINEQENIIR